MRDQGLEVEGERSRVRSRGSHVEGHRSRTRKSKSTNYSYSEFFIRCCRTQSLDDCLCVQPTIINNTLFFRTIRNIQTTKFLPFTVLSTVDLDFLTPDL